MRPRGCALWVMAVALWAGAAHAAAPSVLAVRVERPPSLDGVLDDAAWIQAAAGGGRAVIDLAHTQDALTAYPRVAYVAYDPWHLYVAFSIPIPSPDRLAASITADGGALWNDDEVEIFLQPPRAPTYRHLGMNAVGAITTESGAGLAWEANVAGVSRLYADRWVIELSIPFEDVGAAPRPGEAWGFNLAGHQVGPGQMWLTWSPTAGAFHDPAHFGKLVFE